MMDASMDEGEGQLWTILQAHISIFSMKSPPRFDYILFLIGGEDGVVIRVENITTSSSLRTKLQL